MSKEGDSKRFHRPGVASGPAGDSQGATQPLGSGDKMVSEPRIDRYQVLKKLGEGGMGVVYLALQNEPVIRRVAVKVIKWGMDTERVVARFQSERQTLALMNHPAIAQVYDAGATQEGRPFFVMEYVDGIPITDYCDQHSLSLEERLRLFARACDGVQHAHYKGIVHRDIKPSNVLVSVVDGQPVPKIIDFGVAKAISSKEAAHTVYTEHGQVVGTPDYMSPEQAYGSERDVDSRSDVYSLGVLLFELLVGSLPFEEPGSDPVPYFELHRRIQEDQPPRPSLRAASTAATRDGGNGESQSGFFRSLQGDLDWITLKALEKDRDRRYATPADLEADIQRFLGHEPVHAAPPGRVYRLTKLLRRHRLLATASVAVVVAVAAGLVGTTAGLIRANQARLEAEEQRELAQDEAAKARALSSFLQGMLESADPTEEGRDVRVVDVLDQAAAGIEDRFQGHRVSESEVRTSLGSSYRALGFFSQAREQFQMAVEILSEERGPEHLDTVRVLARLGATYGDLGELERGVDILRQALSFHLAELGPGHAYTLAVKNGLALLLVKRDELEEAEILYREVLAGGEVLGKTEYLVTQNNLALLLQRQGRLEEAEDIYRVVARGLEEKVGERDPRTLFTLANLGTVLFELGRLEEAEPLLRRALSLSRELLGDGHADTLMAMNNLASLLQARGDLASAEPFYREAVKGHIELLGPDHPGTLNAQNNLAFCLEDLGQVKAAEELYRDVLARRMETLGPEHNESLVSMNNLAALLIATERYNEAELWSRRATEGAVEALDPGHYLTSIFRSRLGLALLYLGRSSEAEKELLESLDGLRQSLGPNHPRALAVHGHLAQLYAARGRHTEADEHRLKAAGAV